MSATSRRFRNPGAGGTGRCEAGRGPVLERVFEDPHAIHDALSARPGRWVARQMGRLWRGALCRGACRPQRSPTVLFEPRRGPERFRQGKAVASASIILEADPPAHTRTRAVLAQVLSPTAMKGVRDHFTDMAAAKVDELLARGKFDAVADLAEAYPLSVFPDAMGLKQEGRENLLPYASLVFNSFRPPNQLRQEAIERSAPHQAYVAAQCQRENLARRFRRLCPCPRRCGRHHAGRGAAIGALAAFGRPRYDRQRHRRRGLLPGALPRSIRAAAQRSDALARNAFEEAIRFESPVQTFFRTTTREVELAGHRIGEGEKVLMFLGAANRDPRRWENPDSYDVTRRTSGHVGFGSGIHMCVGQLRRASKAR